MSLGIRYLTVSLVSATGVSVGILIWAAATGHGLPPMACGLMVIPCAVTVGSWLAFARTMGRDIWTISSCLDRMRMGYLESKPGPCTTPEIAGIALVLEGVGDTVGSLLQERRQAEKRLWHLNMHDALTGLPNRVYFEQQVQRLQGDDTPVGIVVTDIDGLKLVNDQLGHKTGDRVLQETATAILECAPPGVEVYRIGGDEFALLLPGCTESGLEEAVSRVKDAVGAGGVSGGEVRLVVSVSIGSAMRHLGMSMSEAMVEADDRMSRAKLLVTSSNRSDVVRALKKALEARDFVTDGHADRLRDLTELLGRAIGLPDRRLCDLSLLAQFHDIGKMGVADRILFKAGPLDVEEKSEMQRHSEIGYTIALTSRELTHIAEWILKHHEWWNGRGYPLGLAGESIPLECRILSIVDAYDAMTNNRPYRRAMPHLDAVQEIVRNSGVMFDPMLVGKFVGAMTRVALC